MFRFIFADADAINVKAKDIHEAAILVSAQRIRAGKCPTISASFAGESKAWTPVLKPSVSISLGNSLR